MVRVHPFPLNIYTFMLARFSTVGYGEGRPQVVEIYLRFCFFLSLLIPWTIRNLLFPLHIYIHIYIRWQVLLQSEMEKGDRKG